MDTLSKQQRHKTMAAIRGKNTKPEMIVRRGLWSRGFRYRLNHKRLPGHPDLVLRKYRTCIFINGCFWHGHGVTMSPVQGVSKVQEVQELNVESSECCKIPKTNREFWVAKIQRNKERDREDQRKLAEMGWHTITIWECELKPKLREQTLESLAYTLNHIWLEDQKGRGLRVQGVQEVPKVSRVSKVSGVQGVQEVQVNYGITEDEELLMAAEEEITGQ